MDCETLCNIIESAGYEPYSYSGRGMYGDRCVGFTSYDNVLNAAMSLIEAVNYTAEGRTEAFETIMELASVLRSAQTDNMGMDTVIYFPRVKWAEED